jgi:DNA-binding MarR family transcriptional regulator
MTEQDRYDAMGIPGLLRRARKAYGNVVTQAFADAGFDDVPRNGAYVLARVYGDSSASADLARDLGISKQAVSQLIDTMVMRGYLARTPDSEDRRRMVLTLTPRGEAAATASWHAATGADDELASRLPAEGVAALRAGLIALCQMADETDAGAGYGGHEHGGHEHVGHGHGDHSHGDRGHRDHSHGDHGHDGDHIRGHSPGEHSDDGD